MRINCTVSIKEASKELIVERKWTSLAGSKIRLNRSTIKEDVR